MTQEAVAKATGIPQNTISWIEADKGIPNILQIIQLAKLFDIKIEDLLGLTDNVEKNNNNIPKTVSSSEISLFTSEYSDLIKDSNYLKMSKLYKAISPELRAITLGYIIGLLQSNKIDTRAILNN